VAKGRKPSNSSTVTQMQRSEVNRVLTGNATYAGLHSSQGRCGPVNHGTDNTMRTRLLFIVTAVIEGAVGLALLVSPPLPVSVLLGTALDTPAGLVAGRLAGAALVALGLSCWGARQDEYNRAANGIVSAMLFYNVAAVVVLAFAGLGWRLFGVGLWPTVVLHALMAVWCLACLRRALNRSKL
jgi:hypothetical protein